MRRAVCGFFFDPGKTTLVLIRKNRPEWQKGLLNGVGGKVEEGEFALEAMIREFEEETGVRHEEWEEFCQLADEINGYEVHYFRAFGDVTKCTSTTDERIELVMPGGIAASGVIPNLTWLVPLALDSNVHECRATWRGV